MPSWLVSTRSVLLEPSQSCMGCCASFDGPKLGSPHCLFLHACAMLVTVLQEVHCSRCLQGKNTCFFHDSMTKAFSSSFCTEDGLRLVKWTE